MAHKVVGNKRPKMLPKGHKYGTQLDPTGKLILLGLLWPVHLLDKGVYSRKDASTSWLSCSGLRGRIYHFKKGDSKVVM
jgi:hypothetical protein